MITIYLSQFQCHLCRKPPPTKDPAYAFLHSAFCVIWKLPLCVLSPQSFLLASSASSRMAATEWAHSTCWWSGNVGTNMSPSPDLLVPSCHACPGMKCHCHKDISGPEDPREDTLYSGVMGSSFLSSSSFSR